MRIQILFLITRQYISVHIEVIFHTHLQCVREHIFLIHSLIFLWFFRIDDISVISVKVLKLFCADAISCVWLSSIYSICFIPISMMFYESLFQEACCVAILCVIIAFSRDFLLFSFLSLKSFAQLWKISTFWDIFALSAISLCTSAFSEIKLILSSILQQRNDIIFVSVHRILKPSDVATL